MTGGEREEGSLAELAESLPGRSADRAFLRSKDSAIAETAAGASADKVPRRD